MRTDKKMFSLMNKMVKKYKLSYIFQEQKDFLLVQASLFFEWVVYNIVFSLSWKKNFFFEFLCLSISARPLCLSLSACVCVWYSWNPRSMGFVSVILRFVLRSMFK